MTRQIWDYPELRHQIGDLMLYDTQEAAKMAVHLTKGGNEPTPIFYNAYYDREGADKFRADDWQDRLRKQQMNGDMDHAGNHELGHVLGSTMVSPGADLNTAKEENARHKTENDILKEVLLNQNILTRRQKRGISVYKNNGINHIDRSGNVIPEQKILELYEQRQKDVKAGRKKQNDRYEEIDKSKRYYKGQLNTNGSTALQDRNITSLYGSSSATEMFAETFGDVYTHGSSAKAVSIATVKEYEKRQKELQKMKFKYNQSNFFMKLFRKEIL